MPDANAWKDHEADALRSAAWEVRRATGWDRLASIPAEEKERLTARLLHLSHLMEEAASEIDTALKAATDA